MKKAFVSALVLIAITAQLAGCNTNSSTEQSSSASEVSSSSTTSEAQSSSSSSTSSSSEKIEPHSSSSSTSSSSETSEPQSSSTSTSSSVLETSEPESSSQIEENPTPQWTETALTGTYYINSNYVNSREKAIAGSNVVKQYKLNDVVTVIAKTDTGYYKLKDGEFIHGDYLSTSKIEQPTSSSSTPSSSSSTSTSTKPVKPFTGTPKTPAAEAKIIGELESGVNRFNEERKGYWVETDGGKFWFCINNGGYYRSMEDAMNCKPSAKMPEVFPNTDYSGFSNIHLS